MSTIANCGIVYFWVIIVVLAYFPVCLCVCVCVCRCEYVFVCPPLITFEPISAC
jgi:hypothetical protein